MPGPKYTDHIRYQALKMLQITGSISEVSEKLGVHRNTISLWKREQGDEPLKKPKRKPKPKPKPTKQARDKAVGVVEEGLKEVAKEVVENERDLTRDITDLKGLVVDRIKEILPQPHRLDELQKTLRTLYEIGELNNPDSKKNQNYLFIQNLTQKFQDYEPEKPITLDGDTEEPS